LLCIQLSVCTSASLYLYIYSMTVSASLSVCHYKCLLAFLSINFVCMIHMSVRPSAVCPSVWCSRCWKKSSADWMINGRLSQHITNWSFVFTLKKISGTDYLKDIVFGKYFNFVLNLNYIRIVCVSFWDSNVHRCTNPTTFTALKRVSKQKLNSCLLKLGSNFWENLLKILF